jgi:phosphoribosylformylglycinamidine (FGAM) synthase PurS component
MTATVKIDLSTPQAVAIVNYLETLPFANVKKAKPVPPCRYTVDEARGRALMAVEDIRAGRFYSTEEIQSGLQH